MSSYPPRSSFATMMSPEGEFRSPLPGQQQPGSTGYNRQPSPPFYDASPTVTAVAVAAKENHAPAPGAFSGSRSPLGALGTNMGYGLRQRRQGGPNGSEGMEQPQVMKGPPRASLTISMATKGSSTVPATSAEDVSVSWRLNTLKIAVIVCIFTHMCCPFFYYPGASRSYWSGTQTGRKLGHGVWL